MEKKPTLALHCIASNDVSRFSLLLGLANSSGPVNRGGERNGTE